MFNSLGSAAEIMQFESPQKQDTPEREKIKAVLRFIHILDAEGYSVQDITKELNDSEMTLMGSAFTDEMIRLALIKSKINGETIGEFSDDINSILGISE